MTSLRKSPNAPQSTPPMMHQRAVALLAALWAALLHCCTHTGALETQQPVVAPTSAPAPAPDDPRPSNRAESDPLTQPRHTQTARTGTDRWMPDEPYHSHWGAPYRVEPGSRTVFTNGSVHTELRLRAERLPPPLIRLSVRSGTTARVTGATLTGADGIKRTPRLPPFGSDVVTIVFDEVPSGDVTIAITWSGDPGRYSIDLDTSGN